MLRRPFFAPRPSGARRAILLILVTVLLLPLLAVVKAAPASAQDDASSDSTDDGSYVDRALYVALIDADLLDAWVEASGVSASAALVEVSGTQSYEAGRTALLQELGRVIERRQHIDQRTEFSVRLEAGVDALESLASDLRRDVGNAPRSAALSLTADTVAEARLTLDSITGTNHWLGISLDPLSLAERRLIRARDELAEQVDDLSRPGSVTGKADSAAVARFTEVHGDLQRVRALIETTVQRSLAVEFGYAAQRSAVVETMAALHEARLLSPTSVGGLPVVSLDAYVRGAQALDASCPVDWALLAGVGRVESRHGTINNTTVQRSGRVSNSILGPLLDGGATKREAAQAAAAAEAEAARLLAEAEADPEEEDTEPLFDASVWGEATIERAKDLAEAAQPSDPVGLAAAPVVEVEESKPRYDPLLWGDDLPFDEEDLPPLEGDAEDADIDEDAQEPQFRGNGFAVISDSDNGRLDGNSRWDRAVGPMQFLPETWSYWETDGNGDGVIDPQNLYDAAATAGQFLCHLSRTRGSSPYTFVLGYNASQTYVRNVMAVADAFAANELPTFEPAQ